MNNIRINRLVTEPTSLIRNDIRRVNKVTILKTNLRPLLPSTMVTMTIPTGTPLNNFTPLNPL
jgi:hypothetical protein